MSLKGTSTSNRRRFIIEQLRRFGKVTYSDIRRTGASKVNNASIQTDFEFLQLHGYDVHIVNVDGSGKNKAIVDGAMKAEDSMIERSSLQAEAKLAIAAYAVALACGIGRQKTKPRQKILDQLDLHFSRQDILEQLSEKIKRMDKISTNAKCRMERLQLKLQSYWLQRNRSLILDAGTTNLAAAKILSRLEIPSPLHEMQSLNVCTNYRQIFADLGAPCVDVRVMVVGGRQLPTGALAGYETIRFMKSIETVSFGMAILGTSYINVAPERFLAMTSTPDEAELKAYFHQNAELKVIVADHTKFSDLGVRAGQGFARLDQIDLIISSPPDEKSSESGPFKRQQPFNEIIAQIEKEGIPVFLAKFPK